MDKKYEREQSGARRIEEIREALAAIQRAAGVLEAEFGIDPRDPREVGYAMCRGARELLREQERLRDRYNPFWADSRRRH